MPKSNEYKLPRLKKQREHYTSLLAEQQQMLGSLRRSIFNLINIIDGEVKAEGKKMDKTKAMNALSALVRAAGALVKIIPLELELSCIETIDEEKMIKIQTREEIEMVQRCIKQWNEKIASMDKSVGETTEQTSAA